MVVQVRLLEVAFRAFRTFERPLLTMSGTNVFRKMILAGEALLTFRAGMTFVFAVFVAYVSVQIGVGGKLFTAVDTRKCFDVSVSFEMIFQARY